MTGSLRARLLLGSLVWILAALGVTGFVLADLFREHVRQRFEAELRIHLDQLTATLGVDADGAVTLRADLSDPRMRKPYSGLYWQIDDMAGTRPAVRSRSLWDAVLSVPADAPADGVLHVHRIVGPDGEPLVMMERAVRPEETGGASLRLIVAADARGMTEPVREFVGLMTVALGVLALGLLVAVALQVSVGLAPLQRMRASLAAVRGGRSRSLEGRFPEEVQPLVDELNAVLAHDATLVERARTQAGNLAHAIKTPLAVLANAAAREEGALASLVSEQVAAAQRQVDRHLARARAAAAVRVPGQRSEVASAVEGVLRVMRRVHASRVLELSFAADDPSLAFRGEEQDLQEMVGNLLDNACKWARGRVEAMARGEPGRIVLFIDDDGPGVPEEARAAVMTRGGRADERMPGAGLGLDIVRELAQLYGGTLELAPSPLGGLRAILRLPAA